MFPFNKTIRILVFTDFIINSGWGLLSPVFAVFLLGSIEGGDASVAGIAAGTYFIIKSVAQIPIGKHLDKNHGEKDDFWFMVGGMALVGLVPLGYLVAYLPWHIYVMQAIFGIGMSLTVPSWGGIFTRHMDKGKEAETWGFESSSLGLGMGVAGIVGGLVAKTLGFTPLFISVSVLNFIGVGLYYLIYSSMLPRGKTVAFPPRA